MRNLLLLALLGVFCLSSCDPSPDEEGNRILTNQEELLGEWVYDNPSDGIWETMKFVSSGVFYFSNKVDAWKIENQNNNGRYSIDGNNITGNYFLNDVSMNLDMTITSISKYSFTALFHDTNLSFTYNKLIGKKQIKPNETIFPDYEVNNTAALGFSSHKPNVAKVDAVTGKITGVSSGHTYIDVKTSEGTAVYEVIVFDEDNMFSDYSFALSKTIPDVAKVMGSNYIYNDENNGLVYLPEDYLVDTLKFITGIDDDKHVEFVLLSLNSNVSSSRIINHMNNKYELISEDKGIYSYLTGKMIGNSPETVVYDKNKSQVYFSYIKINELWDDFNELFGLDDNAVNKKMTAWGHSYFKSDYSYSVDGSDYYFIMDNLYTYMVGFVFNSEIKMCEYWVYLNEHVDYTDISRYLSIKYIYNEAESSSSQLVFYSSDQSLKVLFDSSGYIAFMDRNQAPFVPGS